MKKEELFIYKIANNMDWYLLLNTGELELHYPIVYDYEMLKEEITKDLEKFPSEDDFYAFKSSISVEEKLMHYIISWYCGYDSGIFIMNDKNEVYFIIDYKLNNEYIQPLSEKETDEFLNEIVTELDLEALFNKTQNYYLEHNDEMIKEFKRLEGYFNSCDSLTPLYDKSLHYNR